MALCSYTLLFSLVLCCLHGVANASADPPILSSVVPNRAKVFTHLTVTGENFLDSEFSRCQFTNTESGHVVDIATQFISATTIQCAAPRDIQDQVFSLAYRLTVSNDGVHYSNTSQEFVLDAPTVVSIEPEKATTGEYVDVTGTGFTAEGSHRCLFEALHHQSEQEPPIRVNASAFFLSPTKLRCLVPIIAAPAVNIHVSNDGYYFSHTSHLLIFDTPMVTLVTPSSGEVLTQVTVHGSNFRSSLNLTCKFADSEKSVLSPATFVHADEVVCEVPHGVPTAFSIEIANDGIHFSEDGHTFTILTPSIDSFSPSTGISGDLVTVRGSHFKDSISLMCWFCPECPITHAQFTSDTVVTCKIPHGVPNVFEIRVSNDGEHWAHHSTPFHIIIPQVFSVTPSVGKPGDTIVISGRFVESHQVTCAFLSVSGDDRVVIHATMVEFDAVHCIVPMLAPSQSYVVVSNDGDHWSEAEQRFNLDIPLIASMSPNHGHPGTLITINMTEPDVHTANPLCGVSVHSEMVQYGKIDIGRIENIISETSFVCRVPLLRGTNTKYFVYVATDSIHWSYPGVEFNLDLPEITNIEPTHGIVGDMITVTVEGLLNSSSVACYFEKELEESQQEPERIRSHGVITAWNQISCPVPEGLPSVTQVRMGNDGIHLSLNSEEFTFDLARITSVVPEHGVVGQDVLVHGVGFRQSEGFNCIFRSEFEHFSKTEGFVVDSTSAICPVPDDAPLRSQLSVSNDKDHAGEFWVPFNIDIAQVTSLFPNRAAEGDCIRVLGNRFHPVEGLTCRFVGTDDDGYFYHAKDVEADYWAPSEVRCIVPDDLQEAYNDHLRTFYVLVSNDQRHWSASTDESIFSYLQGVGTPHCLENGTGTFDGPLHYGKDGIKVNTTLALVLSFSFLIVIAAVAIALAVLKYYAKGEVIAVSKYEKVEQQSQKKDFEIEGEDVNDQEIEKSLKKKRRRRKPQAKWGDEQELETLRREVSSISQNDLDRFITGHDAEELQEESDNQKIRLEQIQEEIARQQREIQSLTQMPGSDDLDLEDIDIDMIDTESSNSDIEL